jgi:hypothetical protein
VTSLYAAAREFLERELSDADASGDRARVGLIALRLCEVITQEDFDECRRLDQPRAPIVADHAA